MGTQNNVINIGDRRKQKRRNDDQETLGPENTASIVDLSLQKEEDKRSNRRTVLTKFFGAFVVVPEHGLQKVSLHDISATGISFETPKLDGQFSQGEELALRVYLNKEIYFPVLIEVKNVRRVPSKEMNRHGCGFIKTSRNEDVITSFVKFIESVSGDLHVDHGDLMYSKD
jgi:hypothetical protein